LDRVIIEKVDEAYVRVRCEPSVAYEIRDHFTFEVPGAKFTPSYKNRVWDGKIRLFNAMTGLIYAGLASYVAKFCHERGYEVALTDQFVPVTFTDEDADDFISDLGLPEDFVVRDYQLEALIHAVRYDRALFLSPTASGKSLIIYLITSYYRQELDCKTLIIVPTTSLVRQMAGDFISYGGDRDDIHEIYGGKEKISDRGVVISTWQSIYKMPKEWFDQFDVVFGDEAHLCKAKSLTTIMTLMRNCKYRFGFTGTLDGTQTNKLVIEGLFGPVKRAVTTAQLMRRGVIAQLEIDCLVFDYPEAVRKQAAKLDYVQEMDFLVKCPERNAFIKNLALSLKGNTLILFQYVEKHGKALYELIKNEAPDRRVYFLHGGVDGEYRDAVRAEIEELEDCTIIASYGTFSTGANIKNLDNLIFASPSKSKIRNLQSIGRVLRKSKTGNSARLYDLADDLSYRGKSNITLNHFMERVKIYYGEEFEPRITQIELVID
jgi:superfamily II DNA or RNA helicase